MTLTASYDPDDNKLRLRSLCRLDSGTYARVKAAGFAWAPKQDLFVAPMWTPEREDLLLELCGEIGDEDTSLVERAERKAERCEDYSAKRKNEAERTHAAVSELANGIPLGQPILVGHHSERHARKDAERIENGMRKAIKAFETSAYWQRRAEGALSLATYKAEPAVRTRRIKGLEADQRKAERGIKQSESLRKLWERCPIAEDVRKKDGSPTTYADRAAFLAGVDYAASRFDSREIREGIVNPDEPRAVAIKAHSNAIESMQRWLTHYEHRLTYERALLQESGYAPAPKPKSLKATLPLLNIAGKVSVFNQYQGTTYETTTTGMTKAEYQAINQDYRGTCISGDKTHKMRNALVRSSLVVVHLTDSKIHDRPGDDAVESAKARDAATAAAKAEQRLRLAEEKLARSQSSEAAAKAKARETLEALKQQAREGVKVVSAPSLFPTPEAIASEMVALAHITAGCRVLEPSAGTGNIISAILKHSPHADVVAVEINPSLASSLTMRFPSIGLARGDFETEGPRLGTFDRIIMNPPFDHGTDIRHIRLAASMLRPGGILVAICANGPRQVAELAPIASSWQELPSGTFAGTNVRSALLVIEVK